QRNEEGDGRPAAGNDDGPQGSALRHEAHGHGRIQGVGGGVNARAGGGRRRRTNFVSEERTWARRWLNDNEDRGRQDRNGGPPSFAGDEQAYVRGDVRGGQ